MRDNRITIDLGDDPFGNADVLLKLSGGNEPFWIIRGQDILGARTVRFWANEAEGKGVADEKVANARKCGYAMLNWHPKKMPD